MSNLTVTVSPPSGSSVSITIEADDRQAVEDAVDRYLQSFSPLGYGTRFSEPALRDDRWRATGTRSTSCE